MCCDSMGSIGRDDDELKSFDEKTTTDLVIEDTELQDFDSQFPPFCGGSDCEVADAPKFSEVTIPCNTTVVISDAQETQLLNFDCETQVMDLHDETEVMDTTCETELMNVGDESHETQTVNVGGETQVCNFDHVQDMDTQLLQDVNGEVVVDSDMDDRTEILSDTEGSTATRSSSSAGDRILGSREVQSKASYHDEKGCIAKSVPLADIPCSSGPVLRGFTHIRTASFRAIGLAARSVGAKVSDECSNLSRNHQSSHQQHTYPSALCNVEVTDEQRDTKEDCETANQQHDTVEDNGKPEGFSCEFRSRCVGKAARKLLFTGEADAAEEELEVNINHESETAELSEFHDASEKAGLSYINSQEPGEFSQANALEVVDKFLEVNVFDLALGTIDEKAAVTKPNPLSWTKGTQKLAKKADNRRTVVESKIFDWDDTREDEGGGEFFCKKKDVLLGVASRGPKSTAVGRKPQRQSMKEKKPLAISRNKEESSKSKIKGPAHSSSKFQLRNLGKVVRPKEMDTGRILDNPMDELKSVDVPSRQVEAALVGTDMPDMLDVGIDTQTAAEAIEALAKGYNSANGCHTVHQGFRNGENSRGQRARKSAVSKRGIQKRVGSSDSKVITGSKCTTRSNPGRSDGLNSPVGVRTRSRSVRKRSHTDFQKVKAKKRKLSFEDNSKTSDGEVSDKLEGKIDHTRKDGTPEPKSDEQRCFPEKIHNLQDKLYTFSPVAWRTRRSTNVNHFNGSGGTTESSGQSKQKMRVVDTKHTVSEDVAKIDGFGSGEHLNHVSGQSNEVDRPEGVSEPEHDLLRRSSTTRKRSKRTARKPVPNGRDLNAAMLVAETSQPVVSPRKTDLLSMLSPDRAAASSPVATPPGDVQKYSNRTCRTPVNCRTPISLASPVCMGNEYYKQSCKNSPSRLFLVKELSSLTPAGPTCAIPVKDSRKRRDMSSVRVFFSRHLDEDVTKQQKKILARLGASLASSIIEATHFVTDKFVRTRNMLEAIARGKPVVTDSWLESCGQASCLIDEKNYILRDAKKEKEIGFSMPATLARASQYPLLKDKRVLITPSTKPGGEIISSLVRAVQGQAVEKISRSLLRDDKVADDVLVLSCEDDYEVCLPLMEKGASIYSSEMLLNGIVTQKLEYERHRLFADNVKRTRSTLWLKRDDNQFVPVARRT